MSAALRERASAMVERVALEAGRVMSSADTARVRAAMHAALLPRDRALENDHDARCLAPGRVVRILIADAGCRDADVLCAAAFVDSVDPHLVGDRSLLGARATQLCAAVPVPAQSGDIPADGELLERLVTAEPDAALIAVTERLDQARHLHFRPEQQWPSFHSQVRAVYVPIAIRTAPGLAERLQRWADAFERRRLPHRRA